MSHTTSEAVVQHDKNIACYGAAKSDNISVTFNLEHLDLDN